MTIPKTPDILDGLANCTIEIGNLVKQARTDLKLGVITRGNRNIQVLVPVTEATLIFEQAESSFAFKALSIISKYALYLIGAGLIIKVLYNVVKQPIQKIISVIATPFRWLFGESSYILEQRTFVIRTINTAGRLLTMLQIPNMIVALFSMTTKSVLIRTLSTKLTIATLLLSLIVALGQLFIKKKEPKLQSSARMYACLRLADHIIDKYQDLNYRRQLYKINETISLVDEQVIRHNDMVVVTNKATKLADKTKKLSQSIRDADKQGGLRGKAAKFIFYIGAGVAAVCLLLYLKPFGLQKYLDKIKQTFEKTNTKLVR